MSIFTKALKLVSDVTGVGSVGDLAKSIISTIKSNPELEMELRKYEHEALKLEMQENASVRELFQVEVQSEDPFVRRARPAMLWLVFGILTINLGLVPIINAVSLAFGAVQIAIIYPEMPEPVYWLIGSIFGFYSGARSYDKKNKLNGGK